MLTIFVWDPFIVYLVFGGILVLVGLFKPSILVILLGILIASIPPVTFIWWLLTTVEDSRTRRRQSSTPSVYQADYYYQYYPQQPPPKPAPSIRTSPQYRSPIMTSNWWDEWKRTPPRVNHNVLFCPECKGRVFAGRAYCPHCSTPIPGAHVGGQDADDVVWYE